MNTGDAFSPVVEPLGQLALLHDHHFAAPPEIKPFSLALLF